MSAKVSADRRFDTLLMNNFRADVGVNDGRKKGGEKLPRKRAVSHRKRAVAGVQTFATKNGPSQKHTA